MPIARVRHDKAAFAAASDEPIFASDHAGIAAAGDADIRVVLLRAVDVVRKCIVHSDVVKLRGGLVMLTGPVFAAVG